MKENHATIIYDKAKDNYTVMAQGDLTVNNKVVKTKILESGDVISAGGTTIVFDKGKTKLRKKK